MIVPAMNAKEIIKEVFLDIKSVENKADHYAKDLRRAAIKSRNKAATKSFDYKSIRKNDWIIFIKSTSSYCAIITSVHYLNNMGFNCLLVAEGKSLHHYSGHFLERYNERFLKQNSLSKVEIFKNYIHRNTIIANEELHSDNDNVKRIISRISDGIVFGTFEIVNGYKITDLKTFISNDMILDFQKTDVNYINNNYELYCNENPVLKRIQII